MSPFHPPWRSFPALFVSETITKGSSCTGEHQAATAQPVLCCCSLNSSGFSDESPPTHEAPAVPSAGLDAELYYVRNNVVNHHALSCPLPVPSETNSLHFTWHSKTKVGLSLTHTHTHTPSPTPVSHPAACASGQPTLACAPCSQVDYRLGFHTENAEAMSQPRSNISAQGELPQVPSGSSDTLPLWLLSYSASRGQKQ